MFLCNGVSFCSYIAAQGQLNLYWPTSLVFTDISGASTRIPSNKQILSLFVKFAI